MKIDELLKHLENIKIDEDERREIAEYIARKLSAKDSVDIYYIMTKDRKIYDFDSYGNLFKTGGVSPDDAYKKWGLRGRKASPAGMDSPLTESLNTSLPKIS